MNIPTQPWTLVNFIPQPAEICKFSVGNLAQCWRRQNSPKKDTVLSTADIINIPCLFRLSSNPESSCFSVLTAQITVPRALMS